MNNISLKICMTIFVIFSCYCLVFAQNDNYVAHWKLDGNANDVSGNGFNGTVVGSPSYVSNVYNDEESAIEFDGSTDYVYVTYDTKLSLASEYSISFWIKPYEIENSIASVFYKRDSEYGFGYEIDIVEDSASLTIVGDDDETITIVDCIDLDVWQFFCITFNGTEVKVYKDTKLLTTETFSNFTDVVNQNLFIGSDGLGDKYFNGCLDNIYLFDDALSEDDIDYLYYEESIPEGVSSYISYKYDDQGNRISRVTIVGSESGEYSSEESSEEASVNSELEIEISVSPNPTTGYILISIENASDDQEFSYSVVSLLGVNVMTGTFTGNGDHALTISSVSTGYYIVAISYNGNSQSYTILKE